MNQCECCGIDNGWGLIDPEFEFVCLPCVEGGTVSLYFMAGRWLSNMDYRIKANYVVLPQENSDPLLGVNNPLKIK